MRQDRSRSAGDAELGAPENQTNAARLCSTKFNRCGAKSNGRCTKRDGEQRLSSSKSELGAPTAPGAKLENYQLSTSKDVGVSSKLHHQVPTSRYSLRMPDLDESDESRSVDEVPPNESDRGFVDRLRALEHAAWAELYDRNHLQIWRYALARTGDRDAADDIGAQTFTEALASIRRYRYTGRPILAWLYRIARNLVGKRRRRLVHVAHESGDHPVAGSPDDVLNAIALAEAVGRLTADQREVVARRFVASYSTREIAVMMGRREPAVYSLEARAIAALRRYLLEDSPKSPDPADENRPVTGIDEVT